MSDEETTYILENAASGVLATLDEEGSPYCVPVHFVHLGQAIYVHGLNAGEKIDNILRDPRVSFTAYRMEKLLYNADTKSPCNVNTKYQSVVIKGSAVFVEDTQMKLDILKAIVQKYTPELASLSIPKTAVLQTSVIKITPVICTGKYYQ
ncbi:MAG TPA: pyridoxamine 5'-phosphate oxidase family protein [Methanocorpusculum sp.]|nr:pyridoxamine 5'-phosphate oxidase family protein [Methanocorpusculum sp.]HJJ50598.1 pyridoxamine 5'-phosphate oxidase family protein [Methanocorpusculum sp.]